MTKISVCLVFLVSALISTTYGEVFERTIQFINSRPSALDEKRCTMVPVLENRLYITALQPHTDRTNAHHMVLIGCKSKARTPSMDDYGNSWRCDQDGDNQCGQEDPEETQKVFFTWAFNAKGFVFPEGIGYRIGHDTGINWLVLQVHYAKRIDEGDNSGLTITINTDDLPYQAATYIMGADGYVPPHSDAFHLETACKLKLKYDITPLAYRVHSHHLGDVTSGYVIRNNRWTELGRMSPRQPEQYYMATNQDLILRPGDVMAARCTMNSLARNERTYMGHRNIDEMCVIYILYYTDYKPNIYDSECFENAQRFSWKQELPDFGVTSDPPSDVSNLDGVKLVRPLYELDREELNHLKLPKTWFQ